MNLRLFTIALLISALPSLSSASSTISLTKEDFVAAEKTLRNGETIVSVRLSKSGKAKFKKLNRDAANDNRIWTKCAFDYHWGLVISY